MIGKNKPNSIDKKGYKFKIFVYLIGSQKVFIEGELPGVIAYQEIDVPNLPKAPGFANIAVGQFLLEQQNSLLSRTIGTGLVEIKET